jgi:hypothetical protein
MKHLKRFLEKKDSDINIDSHIKFVKMIKSDRGMYSAIKSSFADNFEHAVSKLPFDKANELAASHVFDDIIDGAFTENVIFTNPKKCFKTRIK